MGIDLSYIKNKQNSTLNALGKDKGIKYQESNFKVTQSQIISLCSYLYKTINEKNKDEILRCLVDCLIVIGNIADYLDVNLDIVEHEKRYTNIESMVIALNYDILRFNRIDNIYFNRRRLKEVIVPQFLDIVNRLGFSENELKAGYFNKLNNK